MDLLTMPKVLRDAGIKVIETPGWRTRSHGPMGDIRGVMAHHTAEGTDKDYVVVRDGRPDLAGPLAQLVLEKTGIVRVIAAGLCWHAGPADSESIAQRVGCSVENGNDHLIGIEGVSTGESWTLAQLTVYPIAVAALLKAAGLGADRCIGHKEWAPSRKIDPGNIDLDFMRVIVARIVGQATTTAPTNQTQYLLLGD